MTRKTPILAVMAGLLIVLSFGALGFPGPITTAAPLDQPSDVTAPQAQPASSGDWRSAGPYGGVARVLALSPNFANDGLALTGGWKTGRMGRAGGYGIVRTTDRGATWEPVFAASPWSQLAVMDLAISPGFDADASAYAATETGLLRSGNRGVAWEQLHGGLPESGNDPATDDIVRVLLSPDFTLDGTLLALQSSGALFLSSDRGATWSRPPVALLAAAAFSRNFQTDEMLFAVTTDGGLIHSTDRGATWNSLQQLATGPVADMLQTADGALLLATGDGVARLVPADIGYAIDLVSPNIPGLVHRLSLAGDHIYAAADQGLFITVTDGRRWDRYADTPAMPIRSVAACPDWGRCHALLAGTDRGVLGTADDNLAPWRWLAGPYRVAAASVVASPMYPSDRTLFAGTSDGLFRSTDGGGSWQVVAMGEPPDHDAVFSQVRVSTSYAADGAVFATHEDRVTGQGSLYQSTDHGATWSVQFAPFAPDVHMALAVSPAYRADRTILVAQGDVLHKTTDGGTTWQDRLIAPTGSYFSTLELEISSAFAADRTLFASGYGGVRCSTDGGDTWSSTGAYAPAYDVAVSPAYASDRTVWHTYRGIEGAGNGTPNSGVRRSIDGGQTWQWATAGLPGAYEPFPASLAASPGYAADRTLFTALSGPLTSGIDHRLYRSLNGGQSWQALSSAPGNPNPADLAITADALGRQTAHMATESGVWHYSAQCEDRLVNGGFEVDAAWEFPITPRTAGYSETVALSGRRSARTGIVAPPDAYSYSSIRQTLTIPAGVTSAVLNYAWYPLSAEPPLSASVSAEPAPELIQAIAQGILPDDAFAGDWQYALLLNADGGMIPNSPRMWTRRNDRAWLHASLDLSAYRGRTLQITFGTLNDGDGRSAAMYVDDVSLTTCWSATPAPTPSPSPTTSPTSTATPAPTSSPSPTTPPTSTATPARTHRVYLPFSLALYEAPSPSPTSTPSPTPTPTPGFLQPRWLRSLVVAPGAAGRLLGLTNEGYLMSSADRGETWTTAPLPDEIAGLPLRQHGFVGMDYNHPDTLYLGAATEGLWRSSDGGAQWQKRHPYHIGPVAVGFNSADTLLAGLIGDNDLHTNIARSTDAGFTWGAAGGGSSGETVSPILIDPQAGEIAYAITQGPVDGGTLYRTLGGMWEPIPNAPIGLPASGGPGLGLAMSGGTRALYVASADGVLYVSENPFALNAADVTWMRVHAFSGGALPIPLAVGAGPNGSALYVTLYDSDSTHGRTLRSDDGGQTWQPLDISPPTGVVPPRRLPPPPPTP
jgi:photosystem II stability/assembly factor-like uncharacterized protein